MTVYDEFPVLTPRNQRRRPPLDPDNKTWPQPSSIWDKTIKCLCGWDSGISTGPNLLYISDDVICPNCKSLVLSINRAKL